MTNGWILALILIGGIGACAAWVWVLNALEKRKAYRVTERAFAELYPDNTAPRSSEGSGCSKVGSRNAPSH